MSSGVKNSTETAHLTMMSVSYWFHKEEISHRHLILHRQRLELETFSSFSEFVHLLNGRKHLVRSVAQEQGGFFSFNAGGQSLLGYFQC